MSSVHALREFICERLTAAAAEIFSQFEQTILRYEEEINRQRRLLDLCWKPELKLHRVDLQQDPIHKIWTLKDQQLCKQERNTSLDQEEPELPQIKVEEQELCTNQEEDQPHLKQGTYPVMVTVLYEESKPEPDREQFIPQSSVGPEHQDLGSNQKTDHTEGHPGNQAGPSATSDRFSCQICGETFLEKSLWFHHVKVHKVRYQTSDRLMYCCSTCGKKVHSYSQLVSHMRTHSCEKPLSCKTCGKGFKHQSHLNCHMRIHTGVRPFSCKTCGKCFYRNTHLNRHMNVHTG